MERTNPEWLEDPNPPQAIANVIGDLLPASLDAMVERTSGKSSQQWEEIFWQRRKKAIKTRMLTKTTAFVHIADSTRHLGLDGDDFVLGWHDIDYVLMRETNQRYLRRKYGRSKDEPLTFLKQQGNRTARRMLGYTIKPEVFDTMVTSLKGL